MKFKPTSFNPLPAVAMWVVTYIRTRYIYGAFLWAFVILQADLKRLHAPLGGFNVLAGWLGVEVEVLMFIGIIGGAIIMLDRNLTRQIAYTAFVLAYALAVAYGTVYGNVTILGRNMALAMTMIAVLITINMCFMVVLRKALQTQIEQIAQIADLHRQHEIDYRNQHGR